MNWQDTRPILRNVSFGFNSATLGMCFCCSASRSVCSRTLVVLINAVNYLSKRPLYVYIASRRVASTRHTHHKSDDAVKKCIKREGCARPLTATHTVFVCAALVHHAQPFRVDSIQRAEFMSRIEIWWPLSFSCNRNLPYIYFRTYTAFILKNHLHSNYISLQPYFRPLKNYFLIKNTRNAPLVKQHCHASYYTHQA